MMLRNFWEEGDWLEESDFSCFVSQFVTCMSFVGWDVSKRYCKCQLLNLRINSVYVGVFGFPGLDEIFQCCLIIYVEMGFSERVGSVKTRKK